MFFATDRRNLICLPLQLAHITVTTSYFSFSQMSATARFAQIQHSPNNVTTAVPGVLWLGDQLPHRKQGLGQPLPVYSSREHFATDLSATSADLGAIPRLHVPANLFGQFHCVARSTVTHKNSDTNLNISSFPASLPRVRISKAML